MLVLLLDCFFFQNETFFWYGLFQLVYNLSLQFNLQSLFL